MFQPLLCHQKIEIDGTNGIAVTYCMRKLNHEGKCSPQRDKEVVKNATDNVGNDRGQLEK